ncbi:MAG: CHAT domain-containing protein [Anaerolineae bacterium]|nr:CHAT domain-containing protein [Anaerolineae bacterium]
MSLLKDFEIEITPIDGAAYRVSVPRSPSGQAQATMHLRFDPAALSARLAEIEEAISAGQTDQVQAFGSDLFDALFADDVGRIYALSLQAVRAQGEGLRIKLRINAPELIALPWEVLYDARQDEWVTLSRHTPIIRYLDLPLPETDLAVRPPLRILGMIATPSDLPPLDVEREKARLGKAIADLQQRGQVELTWVEGQTWRDLQAAMQGGPWHIFHFIGHAAANDEGTLLLADPYGRSAPLTGSQLGRLLADHPTLRLSLLNACEGARGGQGPFSSLAAALVRRGIPAVLAMQYAISDRAAVEFSASFYGALAANLPIDAAVSEARKAISLALPGSTEWATPVLFMRAPDGIIWQVAQPETQTVARRLKTLSWPILLTPLLVLIAISLLAYPLLKPLWAPAQMSGQFRIAVAEFGTLNASGQVKSSATGQMLSRWLFEALLDEYEQADNEWAKSIQLWHNSLRNSEPNIRLGLIHGDTPGERQTAAAALAERINAHMIIYGYLADQGGSPSLDIEFYLSPLVNDETAALLGPHQLGRPIVLPVPLDLDSPEGGIFVEQKLQGRSDALFWLTIALTQDALGLTREALDTLTEAEQTLTAWPDGDGKELLYFFIGRESLFLERNAQAETAFRRALGINPAYARAQSGLGSVYLQRARAVAPERRLDVPASQPKSDLEQAIEYHRRGLELAQTNSPLVQAIAHIAFAKSQRLLGETLYVLDRFGEAQAAFALVIRETEEAIDLLANTRQYRVIAQAYEAQGAAHLQAGDILRRQTQLEASRASFESARAAYAACIAQGVKAPLDAFLQQTVIEQGCLRYDGIAQDMLDTLKGGTP